MRIILAIAAAVALSSCATKSDQLVIKKAKVADRIYSGRLFVDFNGRKNKDLKCELYVNRGIIPDVKLSDEGYVFFKSDSKSFRLSRIACYEQLDAYVAAWHMQSLPLDKFFHSDSTYKATYFGDIYITWKTNPEDTKVAAAQDTSTPQYPKVGRVENSGSIQVEVRDAFEENQKIFTERVQNKSWNPDNAPTVLENHAVKVVQE
jgi:hypothetical protein